MSGDLTLALRTTQSGLQASQTALNAVANNVANVNTPGYSRKIVHQEHRVLAGAGAGVQVAALRRNVDEQLLATIRTELATANTAAAQRTYYDRLQDVFGSPADDTSLVHEVARFTAAVESLAADPDNALAQQEVVRRGHETALTFQAMSATIQDLRRQADAEIAAAVEEIDRLIVEVADLNQKIVAASTIEHDTIDLEDRRDMALDRLAELVDIKVFNRGNGDLVVFTTGGQVLVDNTAASLSHQAAARVAADTTHAEGGFQGIFVGNGDNRTDITGSIRGGRLAGLIEMRDTVLPNLQSSLDEMASQMRDVVNRIHNRGTPVPGLQEMTGSRRFAQPAIQTIELLGGGDVAIVMMDSEGEQTAATTLQDIMGGAGPWSINDVAADLQTWMQANGAPAATVAVDADGRLAMAVNEPSRHLAFRDETASGEPADVAIAFDVDGSGSADETVEGFSYFFGLNDFFVDGRAPGRLESNVLATAHRFAATDLSFHDGSGVLGTVTIADGSPLADVAAAINAADIGLTATLVPDGVGSRLRVVSTGGTDLAVTDGGSGVVAALGLRAAEAGVSGTLDVRADIKGAPIRVSRGALQFDPNRGASGAYAVGAGDQTVARQMAEALSSGRGFAVAGRMGVSVRTFEQYAGAVLGDTANLASRNADSAAHGAGLVSSLQARSNQVRGVDLDEEMSNLILYEQAYAAAARVIATIRSMFDALEQATR
jgi:flagellar hook-associated protein 1